MVRLVSLGALAATCAQARPTGHELFIGPFYSLNSTVVAQNGFEDVEIRFREAYCIARHQGDKESYTKVFNTVVAYPDGPNANDPHYYTREEFTDGDHFNTHLHNVADAFANAKGVSVNTGFFALGTEDDLDAIRENAQQNHMITFVKDRRSFKKSEFKGDDYFSVDYFMDVPQQQLHSFREAWGHAQVAAGQNDGILSFAMGINETEDGSYKAVLQETYVSAAAFEDWFPSSFLMLTSSELGRVSDHPNPFTMAGEAGQLSMVADQLSIRSWPFTVLSYSFDTCEDVGLVGDVVV